MGSRIDLHTRLETLLGSKNVYFRRPDNSKMSYPAIVYDLTKIDKKHANNAAYAKLKAYSVTLIDYDPDSIYIDDILDLQYSKLDRTYISSGLNHFVFTLYF